MTAQQFEAQGGVATADPSAIRRWLTSQLISWIVSDKRLLAQRAKVERQRTRNRAPHVLEYFHQVDDGYSHLAAQLLKPLLLRYDVDLRCHLVSGPKGGNVVEPDLLARLSYYDAEKIAPHYGLEFPGTNVQPTSCQIETASGILAAQDNSNFIERAALVGSALWLGDDAALQKMANTYGSATGEQLAASVASGNARREALNHYSGAMFYYGREWYWGVDRLYHLEQRLIELGATRITTNEAPNSASPTTLLAPRPALEPGRLKDNASLTLEIYPSLRSPYTAIAFDRTVSLARDTGVSLVVRPVLPMVMRGVPVTRQKGLYIFRDAAREAQAAGVPFGNFYDPIGEPAKRCYALYPWACEQNRGIELLSS
ncbi:MAG: 2-hydroxychromene-2-carboxylate isomerase, partial [Pseudomonadales bacterium]